MSLVGHVTIFSDKMTLSLKWPPIISTINSTIMYATHHVREELPDFVTGRGKGPGCVDGSISYIDDPIFAIDYSFLMHCGIEKPQNLVPFQSHNATE